MQQDRTSPRRPSQEQATAGANLMLLDHEPAYPKLRAEPLHTLRSSSVKLASLPSGSSWPKDADDAWPVAGEWSSAKEAIGKLEARLGQRSLSRHADAGSWRRYQLRLALTVWRRSLDVRRTKAFHRLARNSRQKGRTARQRGAFEAGLSMCERARRRKMRSQGPTISLRRSRRL